MTTNHILTIQQVSRRCDVSKSTLRFWEKKFGNRLSPIRSEGGQRRYSAEHVQVVALIKRLKAEGLSLEEIEARLSPGPLEETSPTAPELDHLAERIAAIVKHEVCRFLESAAASSALDDLSRLKAR
jgi:MerR family transcriptional regulator, copper efflux regulator